MRFFIAVNDTFVCILCFIVSRETLHIFVFFVSRETLHFVDFFKEILGWVEAVSRETIILVILI